MAEMLLSSKLAMVNLAAKSTFLRKFLIFLGVLVVIAGVSYGGWRLYRKLEPPRLVKRARAFMEKGDQTNASLTIRHAFSINPDDLAINRLAAEVTEKNGEAAAVSWRFRLMTLQPGSSSAVLECAETALRFEQPSVAREALEKMPAAGKTSAAYHDMFGRTLRAMGDPTRAVAEFAEAVRLEPANESYQASHAAALLGRGWIEDRAVARKTLEGLATKPALRLRALRTLIVDSITNRELTAALETAHQVVALSEATFADQMTLVDLYLRTGSPEYPSALAALKKAARGNTARLAEVLLWMNRDMRYREALEWTTEFTPEEWWDPKVCAIAAMCSLGLSDWNQLEALTQGAGGGWKNLEYLRCALLARALREKGNLVSSSVQWNAAVATASKHPGELYDLAKLTQTWGWSVAYQDMLLTAVSLPKESDWAVPMLLPILAKAKQIVPLWEITGRFTQAHPDNDAAANNFAMYSLLLGREVTHATEIAKKLYDKHPHDGNYVSTYAYSLHLRGQSQEALDVMKTLDPEKLETPSLATYYGVLLTATGHWECAPHFLDLAKGADLLSEEEKLVQAARYRLQEARSEPE